MKYCRNRIRILVTLLLALLCRVQAASAQTSFAPDTITPHYARFDDELPALLSSMSSALQSGLDSSDRAWLVGQVAMRRPRQPLARTDYGRPMTYLLTTGFRGRDVPLYLIVTWIDTKTVAVNVRSPDKELVGAIAVAVLDARVAKLVSPDTIQISVEELDPYNGSEPRLVFTMITPNAPHCRGFGIERQIRGQGDTIFVQVLGVPAPGSCPNSAGLRGASVVLNRPPGRHVMVFDARGDTNVVTLLVTDTSFALVPVRTTYVHAEQTVKWRYPSASLTLRCARDAGDPHFCDALHEFIQAQPSIRPFSFPVGGVNPLGSGFAAERRMVYRYASEGTAAKVRRCVASFPPQTRLDSWVKLYGRPAVGRWWAESPSGSSNSLTARRAPAEGLDASGDVPSTCGDTGTVAIARNARPRTPTPVRTDTMSTFAFKGTFSTTVSARSDGWVVLTPLRGSMGRPDSTKHLYARAADAKRWVQRVHEVISGGSVDRYVSESGRFIPQLGRGMVNVETRVTDSARHQKVSFGLNDCGGSRRGYDVDAAALLMIAAYVEWAAETARRGSTIPIPPTLDHPYESTDVSCAAMPLDDSTQRRQAELQKSIKIIGLQFVVDTAGRVEERSIEFARGTDSAFAKTTRIEIAHLRYRPAEWAGTRVRQVVRLGSAAISSMANKKQLPNNRVATVGPRNSAFLRRPCGVATDRDSAAVTIFLQTERRWLREQGVTATDASKIRMLKHRADSALCATLQTRSKIAPIPFFVAGRYLLAVNTRDQFDSAGRIIMNEFRQFVMAYDSTGHLAYYHGRLPPQPSASLSRNEWALTAGNTGKGSSADAAVDGDANSRWTSDAPLIPRSTYLQIDLGSLEEVGAVRINSAQFAEDIPTSGAVYSSRDGTSWARIGTWSPGDLPGGIITVTWPTFHMRFVRIVAMSTPRLATNPFSIGEIDLFETFPIPH